MQRVVVEHEGGEEVFGITHVEGTTFMVYRNTDPKNIKRVFVEQKLTSHNVYKMFDIEDIDLAMKCAQSINGTLNLTDPEE